MSHLYLESLSKLPKSNCLKNSLDVNLYLTLLISRSNPGSTLSFDSQFIKSKQSEVSLTPISK